MYPKKIELRAFEPRHKLAADNPAVCGRSASFFCGCYISFWIETVEDELHISFGTNGCGYMVAIADILAESASGKPLSDLHGLEQADLKDAIVRAIGILPVEREHCGEVCFEAFRYAFAALRETRIEEFRGDEALICTCFGVSERVIEDFIAANGGATVDSVGDSCRAGSGCGSCRMLIQEMIDAAGD